MQHHKHKLRGELPKIYSQDLINNLFRHPYTKIEFVMSELQVSRITATRYLNELTRIGLMTKHRLGRDNYYINDALYALLTNVGNHRGRVRGMSTRLHLFAYDKVGAGGKSGVVPASRRSWVANIDFVHISTGTHIENCHYLYTFPAICIETGGFVGTSFPGGSDD